MRIDQIALQLYTVRRLMADDLPGTLHAVAAAGYRAVEIAGVPDNARAELPVLLQRAGLRPVAAHEGIQRLREDLPVLADWLHALGCPRLIVPWMPEEDRRTPDEVRGFADELNDLARRLADRDIQLGYHNHAFEFAPFGNTTVWDVLLAELAPEIEIELDVYWAAVAGGDPAQVIRRDGARVRLLHMKDRAPGPEPHDAPAGEGTLDLEAIIGAARDAGVEWYIAEQDEPQDELHDIASAYRYLRGAASNP